MKVWKYWMKSVGQSVLTRRELGSLSEKKTSTHRNGDVTVWLKNREGQLYAVTATKILCDRGQRFA